MTAFGQSFQNGCFDGTIIGQSSLADQWYAVSWNDPTCNASSGSAATPDLTNLVQPGINAGIIGRPFCGTNFMSGLTGIDSTVVYHEGIRQAVYNLIPGQQYRITFRQAVIKQINALDSSGSWDVYRDNDLIGITETTTSHLSATDTALIWEPRTIQFTATIVGHTMKFLPLDDDSIPEFSETDHSGALRMGIDSIGFFNVSNGILDRSAGSCKVLPSATLGPVFIEMAEAPGTFRLDVYAGQGRSIYHADGIPTGPFSMDLSDAMPGMYIVRLEIMGRQEFLASLCWVHEQDSEF